MPTLLNRTTSPQYRGLFPDWTGRRPWSYFLIEQLLEARCESMFPTNGAGPDEDVNIYLAGLLAGLLTAPHDPRVQYGAGPLLHPPTKSRSRRAMADGYRVNGDHRLLYLGLFDRGDGLRRRRIPFGLTEQEASCRDRGTGRACYAMAANLLEGRSGENAGLVAVLRKLETNFDDYVHVLGVLATRRFGLGAVLSDNDLAGLFDLAG